LLVVTTASKWVGDLRGTKLQISLASITQCLHEFGDVHVGKVEIEMAMTLHFN
jgi:hypothetical protein